MNLKVLKLDPWMYFTKENPSIYIKQGYLVKINPIYNRYGYYKYGNKTWFESPKGAYLLNNPNTFNYELDLLNHKRLRECELNALNILSKSKLCSKTQLKILEIETLLKNNFKFKLALYKRRKLAINTTQI